jgi:hypothetical protein
MEVSLSGLDIQNQVNCNIIKYSDIPNYNNIDDLLINDKCVILYETKENYGHWTCIYKHGNTLAFFDSYGNNFNEQTKFIPTQLNKKLKNNHKNLIKLLYKSPYNVEFNEYPLQKLEEGVNTCGRWVIVRLQNPYVSVNEFHKLFVNKLMTPDEIIVKLTQ